MKAPASKDQRPGYSLQGKQMKRRLLWPAQKSVRDDFPTMQDVARLARKGPGLARKRKSVGLRPRRSERRPVSLDARPFWSGRESGSLARKTFRLAIGVTSVAVRGPAGLRAGLSGRNAGQFDWRAGLLDLRASSFRWWPGLFGSGASPDPLRARVLGLRSEQSRPHAAAVRARGQAHFAGSEVRWRSKRSA